MTLLYILKKKKKKHEKVSEKLPRHQNLFTDSKFIKEWPWITEETGYPEWRYELTNLVPMETWDQIVESKVDKSQIIFFFFSCF